MLSNAAFAVFLAQGSFLSDPRLREPHTRCQLAVSDMQQLPAGRTCKCSHEGVSKPRLTSTVRRHLPNRTACLDTPVRNGFQSYQAGLLLSGQHRRLQQYRRPATIPQASSSDGPSDIDNPQLRLKAQAQAPPQAPPEVATSSSTSGRTYSDYYKSQNSIYYAPTTSTGHSSSSTSSNGHHTTSSGKSSSSRSGTGNGSTGNGSTGASSATTPPPSAVEDAIAKAQAALAGAQATLSSVESLEGATPNLKLQQALKLARSFVLAGGLAVLLVGAHAFGLAWQWAAATLGALAVAGKLLVHMYSYSVK